jgi:hypothetical protein
MPAITLDAIEAKQTELSKLIAQFKDQANQTTLRVLQEVEITLKHGEHYAGPVLDADGNLLHHLVLTATCPDKLNWQAATDWATSIGGTLPTRQEQALLYANCKPHLKPDWHWSSEAHENDASYAWNCDFGYGHQNGSHKSYEGSVVAVRSIHVTA